MKLLAALAEKYVRPSTCYCGLQINHLWDSAKKLYGALTGISARTDLLSKLRFPEP